MLRLSRTDLRLRVGKHTVAFTMEGLVRIQIDD